MSFNPFNEKYLIYKSSASPETIEGNIRNHSEEFQDFRVRWAFSKRSPKAYETKFDRNKFKMRRLIYHKNSMLPIIHGEIFRDGSGSLIQISLKLHDFVRIFLYFWFGFISMVIITMIVLAISTGEVPLIVFGVPFFMMLVGVVLVIAGFHPEVSRSTKDLKEILLADTEAEVITKPN